ncbi:hypothetical protein PYJP_12830 [Pyrofollis japonicus]|uniref:hypothetical protein n=1 Tax=Pyrofollis japonicus TaxID=3060460 RepID=UPI00295BC0D7|nr:hypothetical protein [Pyrofollis japonicus]BEP17931.1 hypothetical protein PYJP_12830 [Pyrofollis japonicus]
MAPQTRLFRSISSITASVRRAPVMESLIRCSFTGFVAGILARIFFIASGAATGQGGGCVLCGFITHVVPGILAGYGLLQEAWRRLALGFATFFSTYQVGEWVLGDSPFTELESFAKGLVVGTGLALLAATYRTMLRRKSSARREEG